ncbi:glycosyltransferase family 4 protein [Flavobacteriaceae bacterium]|nr:glycosyltransferase family 4 protein [Flavobacteriaceae bacterium]
MKWLKEHKPKLVFDVLALNGGEIEEEFRSIATNYYHYKELTKSNPTKFFKRQLIRLRFTKKANPKETLFAVLAKNKYDVIYANSAPSLPLATEIKNILYGAKLIFHVHELEIVLKHHLDKKRPLFHNVNRFIAVSEMVKTNLIENWGVNHKSIDVVYEFSEIQMPSEPKKETEEFIVGASGTVQSRKGSDLFLYVANYVIAKIPEAKIKFIWLGKHLQNDYVLNDVKRLNIDDQVFFIGEREDVENVLMDFDVFLMTSREDPFPLVCIEIGMLGKPIVSFEGATGTNEVLKNAGGFIVPYLSIEDMGDKVINYYKDAKLKHKHGQLNRLIFDRFNAENICPEILRVIETS